MDEQILISRDKYENESTSIPLSQWNIEEKNRIFRTRKLSSCKSVNRFFKETVRQGICNSHRSELYLYLTEIGEISEELKGFYNDAVSSKTYPRCRNIIALFGYPDYEFFISNDIIEDNLSIIKNQNPGITFSPLIPCVSSLLSLFFKQDIVYVAIQTMINKDNKYFTKTKSELITMMKAIEKIISNHAKKLFDYSKILKINISEVALVLIPFLFSNRVDKNVSLTVFDAYICDGRTALVKYIVGILLILQSQLLKAKSPSEFIDIIICYLASLNNPTELSKLIHLTFSLSYTKSKKIMYLERHDKIKNNDYLLYRIGSQLPKIEEFCSFHRFSPMFGSSMTGLHTYNGNYCPTRISIDHVVNSSIHNGKLLTVSQFEKLKIRFHSRLRRFDAYPVYLLSRDGSAFMTFFKKSKNCSPCMIIIKTESKTIGAVFDDDIYPKCKNKYYGSPLATVFDVTNDEIYKTSLKNEYYLSVQIDSISIGGGATGCAIYLEDSFETVFSDPCESFDSPSLLPSQRVSIIDVELYKLSI